MATQGTNTINFGTGALDASIDITGQATILTSNLVEAWPAIPNSGSDDTVWVDGIQCYAGKIINGVGFTIWAKPLLGKAFGNVTVNWVWN